MLDSNLLNEYVGISGSSETLCDDSTQVSFTGPPVSSQGTVLAAGSRSMETTVRAEWSRSRL